MVENRVTLYDETGTASGNGYAIIGDMAFGTIDIVTFNGVEYAQGVTHSEDTVVGADVYTVNGAEGFCFYRPYAESTPKVRHPDIVAGESFTLKCEKLEQQTVVTPIPEKYLPSSGSGGVTFIHEADNMLCLGRIADGDDIPISKAEFINLFQSGLLILETSNPDATYGGAMRLIVGYGTSDSDVYPETIKNTTGMNLSWPDD